MKKKRVLTKRLDDDDNDDDDDDDDNNNNNNNNTIILESRAWKSQTVKTLKIELKNWCFKKLMIAQTFWSNISVISICDSSFGIQLAN